MRPSLKSKKDHQEYDANAPIKNYVPGSVEDPNRERAACGIEGGQNADGVPDRALAEDCLAGLACLDSRVGAVADDEQDGTKKILSDGAGTSWDLPHFWYNEKLALSPDTELKKGEYVAGRFALSNVPNTRALQQAKIEAGFAEKGLKVIGWVDDEINAGVLSPKARSSMPHFSHAITVPILNEKKEPISKKELDKRALAASLAFEALSSGDELPYAVSVSADFVTWKALVLPSQLADVYPILRNNKYETASYRTHGRYATGTKPSWRRVQPTAPGILTNGETTSIKSNIAERTAAGKQFHGHTQYEYDSTANDAHLLGIFINELRLMWDVDTATAVSMLSPPVIQDDDPRYSPAIKDMSKYFQQLVKPIAGPMALHFPGGAAKDSQGLRPFNIITRRRENGRIVFYFASENRFTKEDGVLDSRLLGSGEIMSVEPDEKKSSAMKLVFHQELLERQAATKITVTNSDGKEEHVSYSEALRRQVIELPPIFKEEKQEEKKAAEENLCLRQRQIIAFFNKEDWQKIIYYAQHSTSQTVAMGHDIQELDIGRPRKFTEYLKSKGAQVVGPPVDYKREGASFTTRTYIGAHPLVRGAKRVYFDSPILVVEQVAQLKALTEIKTVTLDMTYLVGKESMQQGLEKLCHSAEEAIKEGASILVLDDSSVSKEKCQSSMSWRLGPLVII